ncbi:hypothetical protein [Dyadobacter luticola]|uniref:Collagen-like protein n=1 Tax=Dyadobacter luticola TaxID=1979387 RepID=A0A5R9KX63_9BACT|nr:hypothetical protein [Dyadobacter luticola]TLV00728.1 hypothetical protein FEN17_14700 [Dyadobacter luticola]
MLRNLIIIAFLGLAVFFVGCKGDQGDVGPAGTAGAAGAAGPQGPKGDTGVKGEDGIGAMVIQTGKVSTTDGAYIFGKSGLSTADSAFLANCVIQVYVTANNRNWGMPGKAYWVGLSTFTEFSYYNRYLNSRLYITLISEKWSEDQPVAPEREFQNIRAIIIPFTTYQQMGARMKSATYEETMSALGLTEKDVVQAD